MNDRFSRRDVLAAAGALCGLAGCTGAPGGTETPTRSLTDRGVTASGTPSGVEGLSLSATRVAEGLASPVAVVPWDGGQFVVDQAGLLVRVDEPGSRTRALDLRDRMVSLGGYSERGFLGVALHPRFGENGRLFVRYSAPRREPASRGYDHTFVLAEFRADPDAGTVDAASERRLLEIDEPQANHNAGDLAFGPDGYLYVPVGDGGGANDRGTGHVEDWYDAVPGGNGQDVRENLLGSVLRLDVDASGPGEYSVPDDNPLVGREGRDEHYAWGFRNPWRLSFGPDGRLFVADVGQGRYEEVDVVERGGNYGWNVREGAHCFGADDCPTATPDGDPLIDPVIEYPHGGGAVSGVAVIGGYLYGGTALPALRGRYVFADWHAAGRLFVASGRGSGQWSVAVVDLPDALGRYVLAFCRDADGELLVCTTDQSGVTGSSGAVHRLGAA